MPTFHLLVEWHSGAKDLSVHNGEVIARAARKSMGCLLAVERGGLQRTKHVADISQVEQK